MTFTLIYSIDLCNSLTVHTLIQQQWPGQGHSNEWDAMKCIHNNDYLCICLLLFIVIFHRQLSDLMTTLQVQVSLYFLLSLTHPLLLSPLPLSLPLSPLSLLSLFLLYRLLIRMYWLDSYFVVGGVTIPSPALSLEQSK